MSVLASGVDALYLSGRGALDPVFLERLDQTRQLGSDFGVALPFPLGGEQLTLRPHGWGKYRYCLDHAHYRIGVTPSSRLPGLRVQPRSEFLHAVGVQHALDHIEALLDPCAGGIEWSVNRLDLFCDLQGWQLVPTDRARFVCQAEAERTYAVHGKITGFEFGSRRTKTLCARIYDKLADIEAKGSDWWLGIWGERRVEGTPVARIEFEFARESLRQFGVTTPAEVLGATGDLWSYATGDWLSLREATNDTNRSRWPLAPEWEAVRRAELFGARLGLERMRAGRTAGSLRRLVPAITGYLVGAAVVLGTDALEETVDALLPHVRRFERATRRPFANRVAERRVEVRR